MERQDDIFSRKDVRKGLSDYVREKVVPSYAAFDAAHKEDHALAVMTCAMDLYDRAPAGLREQLDPEILFVAAACHDLGLANGREFHHLDSGKIIRADRRLREWFSEEQVELIAQAAEDHRASAGKEPRTLYGKTVAEADRVIVPETILRRCLQFGLEHYPELSPEEHLARAVGHIHEKYAPGGYLRLWIPWSDNACRLEELHALIADEERLRNALKRIWQELQ